MDLFKQLDDLKQLVDSLLPGFKLDYLSLIEHYLGVYLRRIAAALNFSEEFLRDRMQDLGLSHSIQTGVLIGISALLIIIGYKALRGKIRLAVVLALVVFGVHVLLPVLES